MNTLFKVVFFITLSIFFSMDVICQVNKPASNKKLVMDDYFVSKGGDTTFCKVRFYRDGLVFFKRLDGEKVKRDIISMSKLKSFKFGDQVVNLDFKEGPSFPEPVVATMDTTPTLTNIQLAGRQLNTAAGLLGGSLAMTCIGGALSIAMPAEGVGLIVATGAFSLGLFIAGIICISEAGDLLEQ